MKYEIGNSVRIEFAGATAAVGTVVSSKLDDHGEALYTVLVDGSLWVAREFELEEND